MNESTQDRIVKLLITKFNLKDCDLNHQYWDEPLTTSRFKLSAIDLAYLFFEVEKEFGIRINANALCDYGFATVNGVAQAILQSQKSLT